MQPKPGWRQRGYWLLATQAGSWIFSRTLHILDKIIFKFSNGKQTAISVVAGLPSIMLTSTGAKSGEQRTTPLVGIPDGEGYIVIASNFGKKNHPGWYYNILANPKVTVTLNGQAKSCTARQVTGEEKRQCWDKAVKIYPGYNSYKQRARREIAVFVLEPKK
ncbi:MAG: nitroreductase family deazaflavin-dependent oxidoreductase [Chloroflexi bacterium]|nr:nitroreductase family deazaflavin-dependent oxidoreductase [Chloroflexota bacterium]MBI3339529.1 nitroreductase family deazaflavin-dependent oxidoreductase [Chloroflexota bacterium]